MKVYMVGGAVRDTLLGREPKDIDYVVVGSSPEEMEALGYKQVGADFPVFLHPETGDEYALARTERKSGKGYKGFTTDFSAGSLDPELLQLFVDKGFNPEKEYDIDVLIKEFQRISQ